MNIFIDETGSFVSAKAIGSWNAVVSFALTEDDYNRAKSVLKSLKFDCGFQNHDEIKINDIPENRYIRFLSDLIARTNGALFAAATDSGQNTDQLIIENQRIQGEKIVEHLDKMKYPEGRQAVLDLQKRVVGVPPQLYAQFRIQIELMFRTAHTIVPFFVQREPKTLGRFRWRVDRKDVSITEFERVFEIMTPIFIQSRSLSDPLIMIRGCDYSAMKKYEYPPDKVPTYLKETYGIEVTEGGMNIQKIIREDIAFVDSKVCEGIQVADLIASGLRRCLRKRFQDPEKIAALLGRLMVQAPLNESPIGLTSFSKDAVIDEDANKLVKIMINNVKPFLMKHF
jgi:hypothetical protein